MFRDFPQHPVRHAGQTVHVGSVLGSLTPEVPGLVLDDLGAIERIAAAIVHKYHGQEIQLYDLIAQVGVPALCEMCGFAVEVLRRFSAGISSWSRLLVC